MTFFNTSQINGLVNGQVINGQFIPLAEPRVPLVQETVTTVSDVREESSIISFFRDNIIDPVADLIDFRNEPAEELVLLQTQEFEPSALSIGGAQALPVNAIESATGIDAGLLIAGGAVFSIVALAAFRGRK